MRDVMYASRNYPVARRPLPPSAVPSRTLLAPSLIQHGDSRPPSPGAERLSNI